MFIDTIFKKPANKRIFLINTTGKSLNKKGGISPYYDYCQSKNCKYLYFNYFKYCFLIKDVAHRSQLQ
jgi:hypothetical protein